MPEPWAADSVGQPDPAELAATGCAFIGQYVGTSSQRYGTNRPYIDACLAHGVGVLLILEEWSSQFLGGYPAAVQMMDRMRQGWDALGLPSSTFPAVALVDPNPGAVYGNETALIEFARGVEERMWCPEWTGYGSKYGLDVVRTSGVAPRLTRRWGVGTWGFGERPDGSLPPVDADLIQHGNRGAPVANVDYNTMFRLDMGQFGQKDDDMNDIERGMLKDVWDRTKDMRDGVPAFGVAPWHDVVAEVKRIEAKVDALALAAATSGPNVALLPSDLDAIATKVADKLAARLKD